LWVSEERKLRGMYEGGRREVTGEWRELNNEHLQTSCSSVSVKTLWWSDQEAWSRKGFFAWTTKMRNRSVGVHESLVQRKRSGGRKIKWKESIKWIFDKYCETVCKGLWFVQYSELWQVVQHCNKCSGTYKHEIPWAFIVCRWTTNRLAVYSSFLDKWCSLD
jgi:hypothetical protein